MKNIKMDIFNIVTPKKFVLRSIFLGDKKAKNVFVFVHGLGGNLFSRIEFLETLVNKKNTAVSTFSNRGNGTINMLKKVNSRKSSGYDWFKAGMAHEVFSDCVDDIDGAVLSAQAAGAKNIYLIGHSTGCQKSIYYSSKRPQSPVKGIILLAPMSDYADAYAKSDRKLYTKALNKAKQMIKSGQKHELMPANFWPVIIDAQRWFSLYSPEGQDEIFTYASGRRPSVLLKNKKPILVVLAEADEYSDRPMSEIATWFSQALAGRPAQVKIIKKAPHSFVGQFKGLKKAIKDWLKEVK